MKIKYIKDAPTANEGDEVELDPFYATALIALGYAKEVEDKPKAKAKTTNKKTIEE